MKTQTIINKFKAAGLGITKSMITGNVIVTSKNGRKSSYNSYNEAYRYFFN
jgi:hypothetical protein